MSDQTLRQSLKKQGFRIEYLDYSIFAYFFILIGSLVIPIIRPVYWLFLSIKNGLKKQTTFFRYGKEIQYVKDRRYKTGARPEGYRKVREHCETTDAPTQNESRIYIVKSITSLLIFIFLAYLQYQAFSN